MEFERIMDQLRDQVRIGCFTKDWAEGRPGTAARHDGRAYARSRSWAQYGEAHHGACLVLDRQALEVRAAEALGMNMRSAAVVYHSGFNQALIDAETMIVDRLFPHEQLSPTEHFTIKVINSLFHKNADWSSEREHRIVVWSWDSPTCGIPVHGVVQGLVLGCTFQAHLLPVARNIAETLGIEHSTALLHLNNGVLQPAPVVGPDGGWHRWVDQYHRTRVIFDE